ncbi:hypothetical protein GCM10017044_12230 [Kordiimonas sediminis]|uniref:SnoaL-like domain-containing protein n=1 Tax=Kordiimonas sediminis TaxID=1735581 RepID=A0A919ANX9_9PROT|nr:hypothetical protein [Kordiimonas sediminis]GHF19227.1 hypothetical protein GCM10017044_12230 [Kordiimonas sediminis]
MRGLLMMAARRTALACMTGLSFVTASLGGLQAVNAADVADTTGVSGAKEDVMGLFVLHSPTWRAEADVMKRMQEEEQCQIRRQGRIEGARGAMSIQGLDRFSFFECARRPAAARHASWAQFQKDLKSDGALAVAGTYHRYQKDTPDVDTSNSRKYVLKISRLKGGKDDEFWADHTDFMDTALERPHAFTYKAAIRVDWAAGMPAPELFEVFYYDNDAQQELFLENNLDIRQRSATFNAKHMAEYVYMAARVETKEGTDKSPPGGNSPQDSSVGDDDASAFFAQYLDAYNAYDPVRASQNYNDTVTVIGKTVSQLSRDGMASLLGRFLGQLKDQGVKRFAWSHQGLQMLNDTTAIASNVAARYLADGTVFNTASATFVAVKTDAGWKISVLILHPSDAILPLGR